MLTSVHKKSLHTNRSAITSHRQAILPAISVVRKVFYTFLYHKKGYMLFIVLSTLVIVSLFASILMTIILSQGRLTKHVTSRVQAYYAARGALNYANDRLRVNDASWASPSAVVTVNFCRVAGASCPSPNIIDPEIPASIRSLTVQVFPPGSGIPAGSPTSRRIQITADYAYITP